MQIFLHKNVFFCTMGGVLTPSSSKLCYNNKSPYALQQVIHPIRTKPLHF